MSVDVFSVVKRCALLRQRSDMRLSLRHRLRNQWMNQGAGDLSALF
jgi:hypothetical protein